MRVKTNVLVGLWLILMFLLGLVARIDNNIVSGCYGLVLWLLTYKIGKRWEVI